MASLLTMVLSIILLTGASGAQYARGVDSSPQEGVPQGTVEKRTWEASRIYPGTTHDYWVYVPAQYTEAEPACVMVFQDGHDYVNLKGSVRVPTVFDNLIHKGEMPVTIGIFINPGKKEKAYDQRDIQYVAMDDTYARFLLEEILPEVGKDYNLVDDASGRAVAGMSDGGLASFTVVWERPDAFSKVISHIGSYTRYRGGSEYPYLIRKTRGKPKPIRVFLQDGANDINLAEGNWTLGNLQMESALMYARYDYRFELGPDGHDLRHGGAIFPDTLRWIWRDYPGVKGAGEAAALDAVTGQWDVATNLFGKIRHSVLTIAEQDGVLTATLNDDDGGEIEIISIGFEDGILSYEFVAPRSLRWLAATKDTESKKAESKDAESKGSGSKRTLITWLQVTGDTFKGALSGGTDSELDLSVTGRRKGTAPEDDPEG
jgi:enterochelin esterase family protein